MKAAKREIGLGLLWTEGTRTREGEGSCAGFQKGCYEWGSSRNRGTAFLKEMRGRKRKKESGLCRKGKTI